METSSTSLALPGRRQRFQFSLRTLLIGMFVVACGFGYLGVKVQQGRRQKELVQMIRQSGGWSAYDYEFDGAGTRISKAEPPVSGWLQDLLGVDFFYGIRIVSLMDPLSHSVSDAELEELTELSSLKKLFINSRQITDAGMALLPKFTQLDTLVLECPLVTNAGLKNLQQLSRLRILRLYRMPVTDAELKYLDGMADLKELLLDGTKVSGEGFAALKGLSQLQELRLDNSPITDAALEHLDNFPNLNELRLIHTKILGPGLSQVKKLPKLRHLSISDTGVGDEGLEYLAGATQVKSIFLNRTPVTRAGQDKLQEALPKCSISGP